MPLSFYMKGSYVIKTVIHVYLPAWQEIFYPQINSDDIKSYLAFPSTPHLAPLASLSGQNAESQGFARYEFMSSEFLFFKILRSAGKSTKISARTIYTIDALKRWKTQVSSDLLINRERWYFRPFFDLNKLLK